MKRSIFYLCFFLLIAGIFTGKRKRPNNNNGMKNSQKFYLGTSLTKFRHQKIRHQSFCPEKFHLSPQKKLKTNYDQKNIIAAEKFRNLRRQ
jgi:hypothetical protein